MTIRRSLVLLASLCACSPLLNAQEVKHASTVAQCRADQKLWASKLEGSERASISFGEVIVREKEMKDCMNVDPNFIDQYYNTVGETLALQANRLLGFLNRHNLIDQFLDEDAQGKGR